MVRKRLWKYDRMIALRLANPGALILISETKGMNHAFDWGVCDFFGLPRSVENYNSLRPTAQRMLRQVGMPRDISFSGKVDWKDAAKVMEKLNESSVVNS